MKQQQLEDFFHNIFQISMDTESGEISTEVALNQCANICRAYLKEYDEVTPEVTPEQLAKMLHTSKKGSHLWVVK